VKHNRQGELTVKPELDQHIFYAGLLLALCAHGIKEFDTGGPVLHQAFLNTVAWVRAEAPFTLRNARWIVSDPVSGVVSEANEMLMEAWQDQLITLSNTRLRTARFSIDRERAAQELRLLVPSDADWFVTLGQFFAVELSRPE
jgi:hypothetical protein